VASISTLTASISTLPDEPGLSGLDVPPSLRYISDAFSEVGWATSGGRA